MEVEPILIVVLEALDMVVPVVVVVDKMPAEVEGGQILVEMAEHLDRVTREAVAVPVEVELMEQPLLVKCLWEREVVLGHLLVAVKVVLEVEVAE